MAASPRAHIRGLILMDLAAQHPLTLLERVIDQRFGALYRGESRGLESDLEYLAEKGLAASEGMSIPGAEVRVWRATAQGIDVVEQAVAVPGVEIARA